VWKYSAQCFLTSALQGSARPLRAHSNGGLYGSQCLSGHWAEKKDDFTLPRIGQRFLSCSALSQVSIPTTFPDHSTRHVKGKAVPLQAWSGPEGSRKLRFPAFMTTGQEGDKVVSLTHRPHLPPRNTLGTHFCQRLSRPQGHSATGRIVTEKVQ